MISFEAGVEALKRLIGRGGDEAYYANEEDPLHAAFRAKATVHAGPLGLPMMFGAARAKLDSLSSEVRTKEAVAYVQVPFCSTRCLYCMFYQNPLDPTASHRYAELLIKEFGLWASRTVQSRNAGGEISALYFGGGTPSALSPQDIEAVVAAARRELPLSADCEITLEGRVSDMTQARLDAAARAGINRLSVGVQTFNGEIRRAMMRVDDRDGILRAIDRMSRYSEFALVIDLIYGFPMQTEAVWSEDLETARNLPIDGIDCYQLNVFSRSPLAKRIKAGLMPPAATLAEAADRFAASDAVLRSDQRWTRISNTHWRRTEKERNRYNTLAKTACDCLAFGSGAGGRIAGHTFMTERRLKAWQERIEAGETAGFCALKAHGKLAPYANGCFRCRAWSIQSQVDWSCFWCRCGWFDTPTARSVGARRTSRKVGRALFPDNSRHVLARHARTVSCEQPYQEAVERRVKPAASGLRKCFSPRSGRRPISRNLEAGSFSNVSRRRFG